MLHFLRCFCADIIISPFEAIFLFSDTLLVKVKFTCLHPMSGLKPLGLRQRRTLRCSSHLVPLLSLLAGAQRLRVLTNAFSRRNSPRRILLATETGRPGDFQRLGDDIHIAQRVAKVAGAHAGEVRGDSVCRGCCLPFLLVLVSCSFVSQGHVFSLSRDQGGWELSLFFQFINCLRELSCL